MEVTCMYRIKRLKSSGPFPAMLIPISIFAIFILMILLFDIKMAFYTLSVFFIFFSFSTYIAFIQLRNLNLLVVGTYQLSLGLLCASAPRDFGSRGNPSPLTAILLVIMYFFGIWTVYLMVNKKAKWRGREILELAAVPVETGEDAFTGRPRPVGKVETHKKELLAFAEFS